MTPRKRIELDDGTVVESISTEVAGRQYTGTFRIKKVGGKKVKFELEYLDQFHDDNSLFWPNAVRQMRIHAEFVLRELVRKSMK